MNLIGNGVCRGIVFRKCVVFVVVFSLFVGNLIGIKIEVKANMGKVGEYQTIAAGDSITAAIDNNNSLWAWGGPIDVNGEIGNNNLEKTFKPVKIMDDVISVSIGGGFASPVHIVAIKTDNSLWAWGYNNFGQIGDGTTENRTKPVKIMDDVISAVAGSSCTFIIKSDNSLWTWGIDNSIPYNETETRLEPIKIIDDVISVSSRHDSIFVIKTDNSLWIYEGIFHYNIDITQDIPQDIAYPFIKIMDNVISISAGSHHDTTIIKSDNSLWILRYNIINNISAIKDRYNFINVMEDTIAVSAGGYHNTAIKSDGSLWAWGENRFGQLGNGSTEDKTKPVKIMKDVIAVSAGAHHTIAIKSDGSIFTWGINSNGQLGDGTKTTLPIYDWTLNEHVGEINNNKYTPTKIDFTAKIPDHIKINTGNTDYSMTINNKKINNITELNTGFYGNLNDIMDAFKYGIVKNEFITPINGRGTSYVGKNGFITSISEVESDAIPISTAEELRKIVSGKSYYLTQDINLSTYNDGIWIPIDIPNYSGKITLDGQGHKIINLNIQQDRFPMFSIWQQAQVSKQSENELKAYSGLFGKVENQLVIKNLGLQIKDGGSVSCANYNSNYAGGFVGYGNNITIENSYNSNNVSVYIHNTNGYFIGGLIGYSENNTIIKNSYNNGNINQFMNGYDITYWIGGLLGLGSIDSVVSIESSYNVGYISHTYSSSNLAGTKDFVGGLVGACSEVEFISSCYYPNSSFYSNAVAYSKKTTNLENTFKVTKSNITEKNPNIYTYKTDAFVYVKIYDYYIHFDYRDRSVGDTITGSVKRNNVDKYYILAHLSEQGILINPLDLEILTQGSLWWSKSKIPNGINIITSDEPFKSSDVTTGNLKLADDIYEELKRNLNPVEAIIQLYDILGTSDNAVNSLSSFDKYIKINEINVQEEVFGSGLSNVVGKISDLLMIIDMAITEISIYQLEGYLQDKINNSDDKVKNKAENLKSDLLKLKGDVISNNDYILLDNQILSVVYAVHPAVGFICTIMITGEKILGINELENKTKKLEERYQDLKSQIISFLDTY